MVTLSASTLGAPGESLQQVLSWLQETSFAGIELRLSVGEIADPTLTRAARRAVRTEIEDAGVIVTGIASYVKVGSAAEDEMIVGSLVGALDFAADLGAPMVRVFPGAPVEPGPYDRVPQLLQPQEEVNARAANRLNAVASYAEDCGVLPALETHDSHPTGRHIAAVLEQVTGAVGAIWDLMHPWRVGETLEESWAALSPWLAAGRGGVQVKDADLPADPTPLLIGEGTLPTDEFAELLIREGYAGPVILEWEKKWHPEAVPLDQALTSAKRWLDRHWPSGHLTSATP